MKRRSFFKSLLAAAGASAATLADVPEPERITRIEPGKNSVYVYESDCVLSNVQFDRIGKVWYEAFGENAPKLIIIGNRDRIKALRGDWCETSDGKDI